MEAIVYDNAKLALDIAHHAAGAAAHKKPLGRSYPLELANIGVASDLAHQLRRKQSIALPKREVDFLRQCQQAPVGLLIKPRIQRWEVAVSITMVSMISAPKPLSKNTRSTLGQQPFHTLLSDPLNPPGQRLVTKPEEVLKERFLGRASPQQTAAKSQSAQCVRREASHCVSENSQSINSSSFTNSRHMSITPVRRGRKKSSCSRV